MAAPFHSLNLEGTAPPNGNVSEDSTSNDPDGRDAEPPGPLHRGAARLWLDQKELYSAPFQRANFKWDAIVLAGTGALIATDPAHREASSGRKRRYLRSISRNSAVR